MARFMTREVEGLFKKLADAAGDNIAVNMRVERWKHIDSLPAEAQVAVSILNKRSRCEQFDQEDHSSLEVMVVEVLAKIREWRANEES